MAVIQGNAHKSSVTGFYPNPIDQSLRFNDNDSAYLSRTPASAGNRKTWTWSGWVKRGNLGSVQKLLIGGSGDPNSTIMFYSGTNNDALSYVDYNAAFVTQVSTSALYRDASAWYHIVVAIDTTQATASNRVKMYVNGVQITSFGTATYPSQNYDTFINNNTQQTIGGWTTTSEYFDGYLAEVHFTDGTAYTADAFGEFKSGVWVAKTPSVTYGTNGFYLNFQDDTAVEAFNTVLYEGTGTKQSITGVGFQPDLVWMKNRDAAQSHALVDSVRGRSKVLFSDSTAAEGTSGSSEDLISFDADGFTVGTPARAGSTNNSGSSIVAWCWKAGDSNVSNTVGSITSTVRANDTYGFSIVSYTGTGANATVGHGLSSAPDFIICKNRDVSSNWYAGHSSVDATSPWDYRMILQDTDARTSEGAAWNDTAPTTSVFSVGTSGATNGSGNNMIAYCWAEKTGYSKFGSYTGNGSNDGPEVTCGFKPAMVLAKRTDGANSWWIVDNTRDVTNPILDSGTLYPNSSQAEPTSTNQWADLLDNGFKIRSTFLDANASGGTYIYAAFADTREAAFWLDQSGNDNDWQPVNLDHNDTVADSPTDNFATWNPLDKTGGTFADGNLRYTHNTTTWVATRATMGISSGKMYFEVTLNNGWNYAHIGVHGDSALPATGGSGYLGQSSDSWAYQSDGRRFNSNVETNISETATTAGDVVMCAVDMDAGKIWWGVNGTWNESGDPSTGANAQYSNLTGTVRPAVAVYSSSSDLTVNFGQQPFKYDPPA